MFFAAVPPVSEGMRESRKEIRKILPNASSEPKSSPEFVLMKSRFVCCRSADSRLLDAARHPSIETTIESYRVPAMSPSNLAPPRLMNWLLF